MKINSINQQSNRQNFGGITDKIAKNPGLVAGIAGLATSSVVAQKLVMTGSEASIGPVMDVGIGHAITNIANEKDGKTNDNSKTQAIRTFSQSVGGTMVGIPIRLACIAGATMACSKAGGAIGKKISSTIAENAQKVTENVSENVKKYQKDINYEKWGKNVGGALATVVMLFTNFIIDVNVINWLNKKTTKFVNGFGKNKNQENQVNQINQAKEVK